MTAVEWLIEEIECRGIITKELRIAFQQAKEMEKQQERNYSEEDLEVAYFEGKEGLYSFNEWVEQFKKK